MPATVIGQLGRSTLFEPLEGRVVFSAGWDVALIDRNLAHTDALVRAMAPGGHVILFDGQRESADQVLSRAALWAQESGARIRSLSLLSHASAGRFALGREWVSNSNLDELSASWQRLARVLSEDAGINLFGC